jgi:hypothetical protein
MMNRYRQLACIICILLFAGMFAVAHSSLLDMVMTPEVWRWLTISWFVIGFVGGIVMECALGAKFPPARFHYAPPPIFLFSWIMGPFVVVAYFYLKADFDSPEGLQDNH